MLNFSQRVPTNVHLHIFNCFTDLKAPPPPPQKAQLHYLFFYLPSHCTSWLTYNFRTCQQPTSCTTSSQLRKGLRQCSQDRFPCTQDPQLIRNCSPSQPPEWQLFGQITSHDWMRVDFFASSLRTIGPLHVRFFAQASTMELWHSS